MDQERVLSTCIVSSLDAVGYIHAGFLVPGVKVAIFAPQTPSERMAAVSAHIPTLLRVVRGIPEDEVPEFVATARAELMAAFEDASDPAVLACIQTAVGNVGVKQAEQVADLAIQYRAMAS